MGLQLRVIKHNDKQLSHFFLCHYIPKSIGGDRLSGSILSFKNGLQPHLQAWSDCAVSEMKYVTDLKGAIVIRALGHDEQFIRDNSHRSIDQLSVKLAHALNGSYRPEALQKAKPVKKLISLNKTEREAELRRAYRFASPQGVVKQVLIVDDIMTTGATVFSILDAVRVSLPAIPVSIFTLATTEQATILNESVQLKAVPYEWTPEVGWMVAREGSDQYPATLASLKAHILKDSFE
jgi:hypothetical protein